jgi:exodeoxyribonuclease VII small subunit
MALCDCAAKARGLDSKAGEEENRRDMTTAQNSAQARGVEPPAKGDFERSMKRLEEVVKRLEIPDLSLDDAMKLFEEGMKLSQECQKQLAEAEGRVEILLKKADGRLQAEPFETDEERAENSKT